MFSQYRSLGFQKRQTSGVALVVTLTMLAIVALLAIAFVMTARTELKSGSAYNDQVAAKSLAKMAVDRALMEIVRQNAAYVISGGEVNTNNVVLNYSLGNLDYSTIDNYTNDLVNPLFGLSNNYDFVERDGQFGRNPTIEPYWISVRNSSGVLIGRFAYVGMGNVVDINAIGNIAGAGDTYRRPADANYGYGYIGNLSTNPLTGSTNYTRGVCADVSLQKFLEKLGYGGAGSTYTPAQAAQRILQFRYGSPANTLPAPVGVFLPGVVGVDNNYDGVNNNPSEYTVTPSLLGSNQAIGSLSQLDALPASALQPIAPDPANTNLANYASVGPSADPNIVNPYLGTRVNLNSMLTTSDVPTLTNILNNFSQLTNRLQLALNLIDFHTTNVYPTVYISGNQTNLGIKATPYLNQILIRYDTIFYRSTNTTAVAGNKNKTNYWFTTSITVSNEIWNPYSNFFPDTNNVVITNVAVIYTNTTTTVPVRVGWSVSCSFTSPAPGYTVNYSPFATNVYNSTALGFSNVLSSGYYSNWVNGLTPPNPLIITNIFVQASLRGLTAVPATNLIQQISTPVTNILSITWPANSGWNLGNWSAGGVAPGTNSTAVVSTYISLEADDPRSGILYSQTAGGPGYTLGGQNTTCSPTTPNAYTGYPDTGNREGLGSFITQPSGYRTVGDIGYVYRGEPWATIRLQPYVSLLSPNPFYPYGDGGLMDYFRGTDLIDVAGRININSDTNGPLGASQSPALFALFDGITNSAYASAGNLITDAKIILIINEIGQYRANLINGNMLNIGQMCAITNLTTDLGNVPIPYSNDAGREALIRNISNLITAWKGGGTTEIIGWGQMVKGGGIGISNGVPGTIVAIQVKFKNDGGRVKVTSFQYLTK